MKSLVQQCSCSLTALPSRMTCETFLNLAPHSLSETTITRKVIAWQSGSGRISLLLHRTVATSATVIQLSKTAWHPFGGATATGSGDTDSPTALKALKENPAVDVLDGCNFLSPFDRSFLNEQESLMFRGWRGFFFPFLFLLPFLFPSSVHTLGTSFGAE